MKCKAKEILVVSLVVLGAGLGIVALIERFTPVSSVEDVFGEYRGRILAPYNEPSNTAKGEHRLLLKKDYTYTYKLISPDKEPFIFHGTWYFRKEYTDVYLEDFYYSASPFHCWSSSKDEKDSVTFSVYRMPFNRIMLDVYEEMKLEKLPLKEEPGARGDSIDK